MVTIVLVIGLLNLALGFAVAVCLSRLPTAAWFEQAPRGVAVVSVGNVDSASAGVSLTGSARNVEERVTEISVGKLPTDWAEVLKRNQIEPVTPVETLLWMLHFELPAYRDQLARIDESHRCGSAEEAAPGDVSLAGEAWGKKLSRWAKMLPADKEHQPHPQLSNQFEDLLLDQSFLASSAAESLATLVAQAPNPESRQDVQRELGRLFEAANSLHDEAAALLATLLAEEGRIESLPEAIRIDSAAEVHSRLGLEAVFHEWWDKNPDRKQKLSAVLLDVDRVGRLNARIGAGRGDLTLAALGNILKTLVRQTRGFDRVARYTGQSYLLFLGETAGRSAVSGAERIRQTIEATSFRVGEDTVELTASFAVAEIARTEPVPEFLDRLERTLRESKRAGRNRTCLAVEGKAEVVEPPRYKVKGRIIDVPVAAGRSQPS